MIDVLGWIDFLIPDRNVFYIILYGNDLLALFCAVREIWRSRTSQGSIAWILALFLVPFPTSLLYLVFGLKLFDSYAEVQTHSGRLQRVARARSHTLLDRPSTEEWPVLTKISQLPFLAGNDAKLLIDGEETFASMFAGLRRAEKTILAQFYIIRDDELGREFADILMERARAGVNVHLIYDDVGSFFLSRRYKRGLRKAGVQFASFNQRHGLLRIYGPARINYRSHRKIVVVDDAEAWVGGLNVGNEYIGRSKRFGHWRDTHVHISGPAALACAATFREDWHWATGGSLDPVIPKTIPTEGPQPILVMPTGPADKLEDCAIAFSEVISSARERLWIVSPYFVPDVDMQTALYAAALRGVDVRIMLPSAPDHLIVWLASNAHARHMILHDIDIYRYQAGFLHQKVILVDDKIAGVGTVNFDNRSFRINFEVTLWMTHPTMIGDVEKMLQTDFRKSKKMTLAERKAQSIAMRFLGQAAKLLSPIL